MLLNGLYLNLLIQKVINSEMNKIYLKLHYLLKILLIYILLIVHLLLVLLIINSLLLLPYFFFIFFTHHPHPRAEHGSTWPRVPRGKFFFTASPPTYCYLYHTPRVPRGQWCGGAGFGMDVRYEAWFLQLILFHI